MHVILDRISLLLDPSFMHRLTIFSQVSVVQNEIKHITEVSFLTCCAILPTSFGGKGSHWRHRLHRQSPS
jgi:hypothetical protein